MKGEFNSTNVDHFSYEPRRVQLCGGVFNKNIFLNLRDYTFKLEINLEPKKIIAEKLDIE